jgi:high-affinity iron transporter
MFAAFFVVLREVLEAALIVGIVLAAARGVPRRGLWVTAGIAAGAVGSLIVAAFAEAIAMALEGIGQEIFNASVLLLACGMLGWHNVWMKSHGRELSAQMQRVGADVTAGVRPLSLLLIVVGLAVLREGSEIVLFMYGIAAAGAQGAEMWVGSLVGLLIGGALGALMYFGLLRIPTRHLFTVTGWILLLLAAGMAAQAAGYLVQGGVLPGLIEPLWDTSGILSEGGILGSVLHVLIGYDDQPSAMQVIFYAVAFIAISTLMRVVDARQKRSRPSSAAPGGSAAVQRG